MKSIVESPAEAQRGHQPKVTQEDLIRAAVSDALSESEYLPISRLEFDVFEGVVVLTGVLPSFHMKQIAQEIILKLDIVSRVENMVEVEWPKD
jgi:osmotically-inducible protein OsmY